MLFIPICFIVWVLMMMNENFYLVNQIEFLRVKDCYHFLSETRDIMYKKGTKIVENVYDINGFHITFFTKQDIKFFVNGNFGIQKIIEDYEEQLGFYSLSHKMKLMVQEIY
jgi:hypothetical protein